MLYVKDAEVGIRGCAGRTSGRMTATSRVMIGQEAAEARACTVDLAGARWPMRAGSLVDPGGRWSDLPREVYPLAWTLGLGFRAALVERRHGHPMAAGCGDPEDGVGYVKRNAVAGRSFASWEAFEAGGPHAILIAWGGEAHLAAWERDIANARVHGTTGEVPMVRFARDEAAALQPLADRPPFWTCRTLERRVTNDCAVEVDGKAYSVPLRGLLTAALPGIG